MSFAQQVHGVSLNYLHINKILFFGKTSHYDVVPTIDEYWNVPAFEGLRKDGNIYGRGAQDMKSVCIQYLTAISKLKASGFLPLRTICLSFVPDEEVSGVDGMRILLTSKWFSSLSIGLALDEGLANESDKYSVFYGERLPWWIKVSLKLNMKLVPILTFYLLYYRYPH